MPFLPNGANCQLFAYEVLALHGWQLPDLRSDELMLDQVFTRRTAAPRALDLALFGADEQRRGAHVEGKCR